MVGLRENDKAFEWLEKGYEERSLSTGGGPAIKVDPVYDPLRSDPRFQDIACPRRDLHVNFTPCS